MANFILPIAQAKNLAVILDFHILHTIHQEIILVLLIKYFQNLTISQHFHYFYSGPSQDYFTSLLTGLPVLPFHSFFKSILHTAVREVL